MCWRNVKDFEGQGALENVEVTHESLEQLFVNIFLHETKKNAASKTNMFYSEERLIFAISEFIFSGTKSNWSHNKKITKPLP